MTSSKSMSLIFLVVLQVLTCCRGNVLISPFGNLGEACDNNDPCSNLNELVCQGGFCVCNNDHVEFGQGGAKRCLKKATQLGDNCEEDIQCTGSLGSDVLCGGPGIGCFCLPGFTASLDNKKCLKVADNLGDSCMEPQQCKEGSPGSFSTCDGSKCICTSEGVSEPGGNICLKRAELIGDACTASVQCTDGIPGQYSECRGSKCECSSEGINEPGKHICYKKATHVGNTCTVNVQCLVADSQCVNGACSCNDEYVASNAKDKCLDIINELGKMCTEPIQCTTGTPGSLSDCLITSGSTGVCRCTSRGVNIPGQNECLEVAESFGDACQDSVQCTQKLGPSDAVTCDAGNCACKPGFVSLPQSKVCDAATAKVGEPCNYDAQCTYNLGELSSCKSSKCRCDSTQSVPSVKKDECLLKVPIKFPCDIDGQCPPNGECLPMEASSDEKYCRCKSEFVESETNQGSCVEIKKAIGQSCEENIMCKAGMNFTQCDNKQCKCLTDENIVEANNACWEKKVIDGKCTRDEECSAVIEGNVTCSDITGGVGTCTCSSGFSAEKEGTLCSGALSLLKIDLSKFHIMLLSFAFSVSHYLLNKY